MNKILQWLFIKPTEQKKVFKFSRNAVKPDEEKYFQNIYAKNISLKNQNVWIEFSDGRIEMDFISNLHFAGEMIQVDTSHNGTFYFNSHESKSEIKKYYTDTEYRNFSDKEKKQFEVLKTCHLSLLYKINEFIESEKLRIAEHEKEIELSKSHLASLEQWKQIYKPELIEN